MSSNIKPVSNVFEVKREADLSNQYNKICYNLMENKIKSPRPYNY